LAKNSLWNWFAPKKELQPNYLQVAQQGTIVKHLKQHLPFFKKYHKLQDDLVAMLQKMRNVGQPLSISIVQPILLCTPITTPPISLAQNKCPTILKIINTCNQ
jgi:hypothetical protein